MADILPLAGAIALLIWALKLIQRGVLRGFGQDLRTLAVKNNGRVVPAFLSGVAIAGVSQSSTATALIATTLTEQRILTGVTALFIILGADIGTAGAAFFVSVYEGKTLQAILFILGAGFAIRGRRRKTKSLGKIMIGIGLLLLALSLMRASAETWDTSETLSTIIGLAVKAPIFIVAFAALLTYSVYSSLAVVLLIAQAQSAGLVDANTAIMLVIGANIGGGALPVLTKLGADRDAMAPLILNLMLRLFAGTVLGLFAGSAIEYIAPISSDTTFAIYTHLLINIIVAVFGLVAGKQLLSLLLALDWGHDAEDGNPGISSLDLDALKRPEEGLACAKREALRMADVVERMVIESGRALKDPNLEHRDTISALDDEVDDIYIATKHYIAKLTQVALTEEQSTQTIDLLNFIANLEHIGDIADAGLSEATHKQATRGRPFSKEGMSEIAELHEIVCKNYQLAINAFITNNDTLARELVENKQAIRDMVDRSSVTHLSRLGSGDRKTMQSSSLHLDVLRDLRRINSHIVATAYPILAAAGHVRKTKWKVSKTRSLEAARSVIE